MAQFLHPGVYTLEIDSQPKVTGVGATTGAFIGLAEKGPVDKAILTTSFQDFNVKFGGYFKKWYDGSFSTKTTYLAHSVEAFFKSGGTACWIIRPTISGSAAVTANLPSLTNWTSAPTGTAVATVTGLSPGSWYNYLSLDNQKTVATSITPVTQSFTITAANPGVLTVVTPLPTYTPIVITVSGGTLSGITSGNIYYLTQVTSTTYKISTTYANAVAGTYVNTSGGPTGSPTYSMSTIIANSSAPHVSVIPFNTATELTGFEPGDVVVVEKVTGTGVFDTTVTFGYNSNVASQTQVILAINGSVVVLGQALKCDASTVTQVRIRTASRHKKTIIGLLDATTTLTSASTYIDVGAGQGTGLVQGQDMIVIGTVDGTAPDPVITANGAGGVAYAKGTVDSVFQYPTFDRIQLRGSLTTLYSTGTNTKLVGTTTSTQPVIIVSLETTLNVYNNGELVEVHEYLSSNPLNSRDYIGSTTIPGRLYSDSSNESNYIKINQTTTNADATIAGVWMTSGTNLISSLPSYSAGSDGTFPTTNVGLQITNALLYMKDALDASMLACPDIAVLTSEAEVRGASKTLSDYGAITNPDVLVFLGPPNTSSYISGTSSVQNMLTFRNALAIDSSRTALFWPMMVCPDPTSLSNPSQSSTAFSTGFNQSVINLPPQGFVMGQHARVTAARGPHVAGANIPHIGVFDVSYHCSNSEQDFLNPRGINCIRQFPGQGVLTWGCRTLYSITDGRHYIPVVRLLQFIERSVREGNRFAVFQPNDPLLWAQVTAANKSFLSSIWSQGMLFPSNDETQAYFVKCDEETNPPSERAQGRLNCIIGVNPPKPAEFVIFRVGIFDGAAEIQTVIQGANAAGFLVG